MPDGELMAAGTIHKTIALFREALFGLGLNIPLIKLEALGIMVHEAMSVHARSFHTPQHIFSLSDASNPIQALAALFHDVVYFEIDQGFTPEIEQALKPYLRHESGQLRLRPREWTNGTTDGNDEMFKLTLEVFGFEPGQLLSPSQGQNEFLSALLMNEKLQYIVPARELIKITACIEATIPFRGRNERGETPAEVLEQRLVASNAARNLGLSQEEIETSIVWAVEFSNRDVDNFSEPSTGKFLDNTWKLLPESNPSLRLQGIYSIVSYRRALQKMEAFLNHLDPETIFNQYHDSPTQGDYERMHAMAYRNVQTARHYLQLKLLSAGIVEALAATTGGNAPIALFMGPLDDAEGTGRLEDFLPDVSSIPSVDESSTLFGLLAFGRASSTSFDLQNSPIALFAFRLLGLERAHALLDEAKAMFNGGISPEEFLDRMPTELVVPIANACASMVITRRTALRAYANTRLHQATGHPATPGTATVPGTTHHDPRLGPE
jgi:hypothetical protein